MELEKFAKQDLADPQVYDELQTELVGDLRRQLAVAGLEFVSLQPNTLSFGAVAAAPEDEEGMKRFIHIGIENV